MVEWIFGRRSYLLLKHTFAICLITKPTILKRLLSLLTIIIVSTCSVNAQVNNINDTIEPKSTFEINISGRQYIIAEGEVLNLDTTLTKASIKVKVSDNKKFKSSSLSFEYPKYLAFDFSSSEGLKNWTFTGNNIVIILFEFEENVPLGDITEEMINKFGKANCSSEDFQKELGSRKLDGKRLNVTIAGSPLVIDMYDLKVPGNNKWVLYFQNSVSDDGNYSEESKHIFRLLDSTLKVM